MFKTVLLAGDQSLTIRYGANHSKRFHKTRSKIAERGARGESVLGPDDLSMYAAVARHQVLKERQGMSGELAVDRPRLTRACKHGQAVLADFSGEKGVPQQVPDGAEFEISSEVDGIDEAVDGYLRCLFFSAGHFVEDHEGSS